MDTIKENLIEIIKSFLTDEEIDYSNLHHVNKALQIIMGNSVQALTFVSIIEDEFDIEFDDYDVNLNSFLDIEALILLLNKYCIGK